MTSFAKHIAVFAAALIATTALAEKSGDGKATPSPDGKETPVKKSKKSKGSKNSEDPNAPKKMDIPVQPGHPSKGLTVPYFDSSGKRQMNFQIGVASRIDANHIEMTDMQVETLNEEGGHEMQIDLPTSIFDTDTSIITTNKHVTIKRADFDLTGEAMVFNTKTKQGGLGGGVRMLIYNLDDETADAAKPGEAKGAAKTPKPKNAPDTFKTPQRKDADGAPASGEQADKFYTPGPK